MSKCLNPVKAWICGYRLSKDGVVSPNIVFSPNKAIEYFTVLGCLALMDNNVIEMPCGHCANCEMRKRKDMSVRLAHEASMHEVCCFLTLTYDDDHVPTTCWNPLKSDRKMFDRGLGSLPELTLMPRDVQLFMKRLRRQLEYHHGIKGIRYFAVGEYGTRTHRPHYHILIFGWKPSDLDLLKMHKGNPVYRSAFIERQWKYGFSSVSDVNPYVAKYAARYVTKKFARLERDKDNDYVVPEFVLQSTKHGGIGAPWFDKYGVDACKVGLCTVRSSVDRISKCTIPRYYWSRLRKTNIAVWLHCRDEKIEWLKTHRGEFVSFADRVRSADYVVNQIAHEVESEVF